MKHVLVLFSFLLFADFIFAQTDADLFNRADSLHKIMFSIDTHIDTPICTNHPDDDYGVDKGQVTFPLMKKGGLDAALFAIYIEQGGRTDDSLRMATEYVVNEINLFKEHVKKNKKEAGIAYKADDFWKLKKKGKSIVMFSIENGYAFGKDISNVEMFYKLGVRAIVMCHNYDNDVCDASRYQTNEWGGLSPFGYDVVREMNRLGMIVDISHGSTATLYDCLEASKSPIIASHSACYAIKNHPRNLTDQEMRDIAAKGGLVQVSTGTFFISNLPDKVVTIKHIADHIEYAASIIGMDHVGIGTDFDGGGGNIGFENASKARDLTVELMRRGFSDDEIQNFWGRNFLRVLREVERVSREK